MTGYVRLGTITAKSGMGEELANLLIDAANLLKKDDTCHQYIVGTQSSDPDTIFVSEIWNSKDDHGNSLMRDDIREIITNARALIDGQPSLRGEFNIMGGHR